MQKHGGLDWPPPPRTPTKKNAAERLQCAGAAYCQQHQRVLEDVDRTAWPGLCSSVRGHRVTSDPQKRDQNLLVMFQQSCEIMHITCCYIILTTLFCPIEPGSPKCPPVRQLGRFCVVGNWWYLMGFQAWASLWMYPSWLLLMGCTCHGESWPASCNTQRNPVGYGTTERRQCSAAECLAIKRIWNQFRFFCTLAANFPLG